jgi:ankyrin repeat protein
MQAPPFHAPAEAYLELAEALLAAWQAGDRAATLDLAGAKLAVARELAFDSWQDLLDFAAAVARGGATEEFERAVEAVVDGDLDTLRRMIARNPQLVHARSTRRHHATLLHYIAANGVEDSRQRTPANAVAVARLLLDHGAEPDALADMYEHQCTPMSMLVSSEPPARAGLQLPLAETLLDYGAALEGPGTNWQSAILTALQFGYGDTAEALARRGAPRRLEVAAGLGRLDDVAELLPAATALARHAALALAAQHGRVAVVRLLLDAGEDPDRYNPEGYHAHATPLHQAVWSNQEAVVRLLVERGARLDIADKLYSGTPLDWAVYGGREAIAQYLRSR